MPDSESVPATPRGQQGGAGTKRTTKALRSQTPKGLHQKTGRGSPALKRRRRDIAGSAPGSIRRGQVASVGATPAGSDAGADEHGGQQAPARSTRALTYDKAYFASAIGPEKTAAQKRRCQQLAKARASRKSKADQQATAPVAGDPVSSEHAGPPPQTAQGTGIAEPLVATLDQFPEGDDAAALDHADGSGDDEPGTDMALQAHTPHTVTAVSAQEVEAASEALSAACSTIGKHAFIAMFTAVLVDMPAMKITAAIRNQAPEDGISEAQIRTYHYFSERNRVNFRRAIHQIFCGPPEAWHSTPDFRRAYIALQYDTITDKALYSKSAVVELLSALVRSMPLISFCITGLEEGIVQRHPS